MPNPEYGGRTENQLLIDHYVLEGMYEEQGREYPAGTYRLIPKHNEHGPFGSRGGALVFIVWED